VAVGQTVPTRDVVARLRREGWKDESGRGSHLLFKKDGITVSVPTSKKEIAKGTYNKIAKLTGWK
jgi:predicted RNA binding protein YcfA (HicA-like mRNA interferase family)